MITIEQAIEIATLSGGRGLGQYEADHLVELLSSLQTPALKDDFPSYQDWRLAKSSVRNPAVQDVLDRVKYALDEGGRFPKWVHCWPEPEDRDAITEILTHKGWKVRWQPEDRMQEFCACLVVDRGD